MEGVNGMGNRMRTWLLMAALLALGMAVLTGCETRYITTGGGGSNTPEFWINFEKQPDNTVRFYTNDRRLLGVSGSTHWKIGTVSAQPMTEFTVTVQKSTGSVQGGYGVVFAAADADHFLVVLIDTTQHYKVGKFVRSTGLKVLTDWTEAAELNGGYVANTIRIAFTAPNQYRIYFNGDTVGKYFQDNDAVPYTGGFFGYVAEVHATDSFPDVPVDVSFTQVTPVDIGM
jgi:hypothetical protein